jgi:hypothetical protein
LATAISHPAGVGRQRAAGPAADRHGEGFLHGILGQPEVAGQPGEHGDSPAPFLPEELFDLGAHPLPGGTMSGRTSMQPNLAAGMVAAHRSASSRSAQSST